MAMTAKQIGKRIKAKGLGRLKWYCQMCQKQCRDENGFKCHTASETHLRQMELFAQNPEHYLDELSNEFETNFLTLLGRRFNTTKVDANKVYNEFIQDKEHMHMNSTKWETLTGFVQYLGRTGKVRVEESEKGLYISWIDRNPEAMARAERTAQKEREMLDDSALSERMMKQRLALAIAATSSTSVALRPTSRDDTAAGVQLDAQGNIVLGIAGSSSSLSSTASRKRPADSRPTLSFGRGSGVGSKQQQLTPPATNATNATNAAAAAGLPENHQQGTTTSATASARPTITFEQAPSNKRARLDDGGGRPANMAPRSAMWMCEGLVVKIKNKQVGGGSYYKKKGRIGTCNVDHFTADVRMLECGTKIRIHQKDLETVIPKPRLTDDRSKVMLLRGKDRGLMGTLVALHVDTFSCDVEVEEQNQKVITGLEYEDVCKLMLVDPYKKSKKSKKSKKNKKSKKDKR